MAIPWSYSGSRMNLVSLADATQLHRIRWQYFGTLTFTQANLSTSRRMRMVFALLRKISAPLGVPIQHLRWVLRLEEGEVTRRRHFHLLIGGLPDFSVSKRSCFALMKTWEKLGGGMARCRIYDAALAGERYIRKNLGYLSTGDTDSSAPVPSKSLAGANAYEVNKFASDEVLELTASRTVLGDLLKLQRGSNAFRGRHLATGRH